MEGGDTVGEPINFTRRHRDRVLWTGIRRSRPRRIGCGNYPRRASARVTRDGRPRSITLGEEFSRERTAGDADVNQPLNRLYFTICSKFKYQHNKTRNLLAAFIKRHRRRRRGLRITLPTSAHCQYNNIETRQQEDAKGKNRAIFRIPPELIQARGGGLD
ncbi:hypothetical protein EVAR_75409_1 [Eumeta japonica]|uniref:Uncharacterized protein n=1 Tax=Eumeta variegata TaxID=151549 RepID=A0A4C1TMV4_EUMVA|nr:hypothetical protein EVAR_75409_1 [Eumeta japonica]